MKIALPACLAWREGALVGTALGIGAGLAWVEVFKITSFEGDSGMPVFFTFMPLQAVIAEIGGVVLFGIIAFATPKSPSSVRRYVVMTDK